MERPIKLTYMIDMIYNGMGGTEVQLLKMIDGLDKKKFQLTLVCLRDHPWLAGKAPSLDCQYRVFEINRLKKLSTYINFFRLVAYLRHSKPDVVHTFFPVSNIVGVIAARMAGITNIVSSRRDYGEWMRGSYLFATRFANRFVKKILANSNAVKSLTQSKEHVNNGKVEVIYNGIDTGLLSGLRPDNELKKSLNMPLENKVVGIVANFRPMKHHHTFLHAAAQLLKTRDNVSFLLVGTGQLQEELESLSKDLDITRNVCFSGAQRDVAKYLSIMDIGVNCSEAEGLSNAVMEYMSAGIPCIVTKTGGNTDLITHDVNGYLFELDDHDALCSLVGKLLDDRSIRERLLKKARETVESKMSLSFILAAYEDFYERLSDVRH